MAFIPLRDFARNFNCTALTLPAALLLSLTLSGCPATQPVSSPGATGSQATAPALQPAEAPAAPPPPAPLTPDQRKAQQLIAQVERDFHSGEAHYGNGQLVQAKADFDKAVDRMLASGLDIKADQQLDDEFNRILDAVNALEMEALKRGNGFAPNVEPSPADVANDVTFTVDPNLVAKARAELATTKSDLPLVINDYVAAYINFFANTQRGHNTLLHSFQRAGRYKAMIQQVLKEEGVPQDLIYLAVAESSFQPQAVNGSSGAGGMWQFMPHGDYGLARNGYVDERFDPEKSTRAYAKYMKFLYYQLGDWYLAMAAYDWGAGSIQRAVQKTGYADFWELYKRNNLPAETKNYVPEILAAIIIARNPHQYGFDDVQLDAPIVTDTVPIDYAVDLRLVADLVDAEPQELIELNPGLLRMTTPPPGVLTGPFELHLPAGAATIFKQRISEIPEDRRTQWRYHRITPDDSLASIARSYHVSVEQLETVNQLQPGESLDNVEALVVPVPPPAAIGLRTEVYRARRGDTLVKIADRFGVSLDDLRRWNHVTGTSVAAGQRIRVSEPVRIASHGRGNGHSSTQDTHPAKTHKARSGHAAQEQTISKSASTKNKKHTSTKTDAAAKAHKTGDSKGTGVHHKSTSKKKVQK
jgi:membrane-bound lytic murein transglycosylase D